MVISIDPSASWDDKERPTLNASSHEPRVETLEYSVARFLKPKARSSAGRHDGNVGFCRCI